VIAYNEEQNIAALMQKIINEDIKKAQIFVDTGGSTDKTAEMVDIFEKKYPEKVTHIRGIQRVGKHIAYNSLLNRVKGYKYVVYMDADINLHYKAIHYLVRYLINHPEYKIVGPFLNLEQIPGKLIERTVVSVYQKVRKHIVTMGRYRYLQCKSFAAMTRNLPYIPENSDSDEYFLNLQFDTGEIGTCVKSVMGYVMPYSLYGLYVHSFHLGNTLADIKNNFSYLWSEQIKRIPLIDYAVFGLTRYGFNEFWRKLSFTERLVFIYTRLVTMTGFYIGFYSRRKALIWEPIKETKRNF
jgi:glycosyltransferase involved in cell wall biosynthesis